MPRFVPIRSGKEEDARVFESAWHVGPGGCVRGITGHQMWKLTSLIAKSPYIGMVEGKTQSVSLVLFCPRTCRAKSTLLAWHMLM